MVRWLVVAFLVAGCGSDSGEGKAAQEDAATVLPPVGMACSSDADCEPTRIECRRGATLLALDPDQWCGGDRKITCAFKTGVTGEKWCKTACGFTCTSLCAGDCASNESCPARCTPICLENSSYTDNTCALKP